MTALATRPQISQTPSTREFPAERRVETCWQVEGSNIEVVLSTFHDTHDKTLTSHLTWQRRTHGGTMITWVSSNASTWRSTPVARYSAKALREVHNAGLATVTDTGSRVFDAALATACNAPHDER